MQNKVFVKKIKKKERKNKKGYNNQHPKFGLQCSKIVTKDVYKLSLKMA